MGADHDHVYSLPDNSAWEPIQFQYDPNLWREARGEILTNVTAPEILQALQEASEKSSPGFTLDTHLAQCGNYGLVQVIYVLDAARVPNLSQPMQTDVTFNPKTATMTIEAPSTDPNKHINPLTAFFLRYYPSLGTASVVPIDRSHTTPASAVTNQADSAHPTTIMLLSPYIHTEASVHIVRALGGRPSTAPLDSKFEALIIARQ